MLKVQPINSNGINYAYFKKSKKKLEEQSLPSFKAGLKQSYINEVNKMSVDDISLIAKNLKNKYNMEANFDGSKTIAWCVNKVSDIMHKAGFKLPRKFEPASLEQCVLGQYDYDTDIVNINSNNVNFRDLNKLNHLEEHQGGYHPKTRHFLHTYIHEFMHAANLKNILEKHGREKGAVIIAYLRQFSPKDYIVGPVYGTVQNLVPSDSAKQLLDEIFPPDNGLYAKTNLAEYFAEKNAKKMSEYLMNDWPVGNYEKNIKIHPKDWNFKEELRRSIKGDIALIPLHRIIMATTLIAVPPMPGDFTEEILNQEINYTDGDIYYGNISDQLINATK